MLCPLLPLLPLSLRLVWLTLRRFLRRGTRSVLGSMLAYHGSIMLTWILVLGVVAVHGRRAAVDLVRPWCLLGGDDGTQLRDAGVGPLGPRWASPR